MRIFGNKTQRWGQGLHFTFRDFFSFFHKSGGTQGKAEANHLATGKFGSAIWLSAGRDWEHLYAGIQDDVIAEVTEHVLPKSHTTRTGAPEIR